MDFLGIGPLEIIFILILGFLFWGPEKLPEIASQLGKWYRKFTRATFELTRTISDEMSAEKKEIKEDRASLAEAINKDLKPQNLIESQPAKTLSQETTEKTNE